MSAKPRTVYLAFSLAIGLLLAVSAPAFADVAQIASSEASAPYIMVTSEGVSHDSLPLKSSKAQVQIAGVMAHVTIKQVYQNKGDMPLEAVYVFPGSTRAAVFGMEMRVGERVTKAKIKKREAARQIYEAAKEEGKTASLLEQHRPNVFQMNVANILPNDTVEVTLKYTELMIPKDGVYEFVYPAVVGPRYSGEQNTGETWHENTYGAAGAGAPYEYGIRLNIATGVPLQGLSSPSHSIKPTFDGKKNAHFALVDKRDGDRDFVLRYRLRGGAIETGLLRFEDDEEKFFLLMLQPPKTAALDDMPAREYVFIVDVSGSMSGFPLTVSKKLIKKLLSGLRAQDSFNMLFFAGGNYQLSSKSVPATKANISRALRVLDEQRGGGGTNLVAALQTALKMPASDATSRTFIAVTDGFISADDSAFAMVRKNLGRANFFAFGIGSSVNRNLIEGLARAGMGEPFVALNQNDAIKQANKFHKLISSPMLTRVRAKFRGFQAYDVIPKKIPDLFSDRPLVIFGKYKGKGGSIEVSGIGGTGKFERSISLDEAAPSLTNAGLRYLWARHRIAELDDRIALRENDRELEREVTSLGLTYNLLTRYTSFVAVDPNARPNMPQSRLVNQVLPAPPAPLPMSPGRTMSIESSGDYGDDDDDDYYIIDGAIAISGRRATMLERSTAHSAFATRGLSVEQGFRFAVTDDKSHLTLPFLLRLGVGKSAELRLGTTLAERRASQTLSPDLRLGAKVELPAMDRLHFALLAEFGTAFDTDELKQYSGKGALLAETNVFGLGLRANLGLGHLRLRDTTKNLFGFAYGGELSWTKRLTHLLLLQPYLGISGLAIESAGESFLEFGNVVQLGPSWGVGIEAQIGLTDKSENFATGMFLRYRL